MQVTAAEEDHLKAIFQEQWRGARQVRTNALAARLQLKAATVSETLNRLATKGLIDHVPYKGVQLTAQGQKQALLVLRRHRLWETFLNRHLGFSWSDVHPLAEELEHIASPELIERLAEYLGHPDLDPHGDPIPTADGRMAQMSRQTLAEAPLNHKLVMTGVADSSASFLQYLERLGLRLGTRLETLHREPYDNSLLVRADDAQLRLSETAARNVLVSQP